MSGRSIPWANRNLSSTAPTDTTTLTTIEENHEDGFAPYISIIIFSILTIIFNSGVIFIIPYFPNLRSRNSNKFLLNLMVSNLCVGLVMLCFGTVVVTFNSSEHTFGNHNKPPASISLMFGVLILLSVMNMILLSGDRLYAVKWTFRYLDSTTSKQIHTAIVLPWIISLIYFTILIALLHVGNEHIKDIVHHVIYITFDIFAVLGFLTLTVSSTVIYREARIQLVRIAKTSVSVSVLSPGSKPKEKQLRLRELRLALINIGLVIKFVVFWLPTLATMTYHLIWEAKTSKFVEYLSFHLVLINCVCDPTVYVLLSRDIHRAILFLTFGESITEVFAAGNKRTKPRCKGNWL